MKTLTLENLAGFPIGKDGVKVKLTESGLRELWDSDDNCEYLNGLFTISFIDFENNTVQIRSVENEKYTYEEIELDWIHLVLHPLSDLTKPIKDSCHLLELAKIAFNTAFIEKHKVSFKADGLVFEIKIQTELHVFQLAFFSTDQSFFAIMDDKTIGISNQLALFRYLYKNHFDVDGLLEDGLALKIED